jgi:tetratricopeptide (TPR) repeat protein
VNNTNSEKRGRVIPKWLTAESTRKKGETLIPRETQFSVNDATKAAIEKELASFRETPTLDSASYLLGASLLIGDSSLANEAAHFIRDRGDPGSTITEFADNIMGVECMDLSLMRIDMQIAKTKAWVREFSRNALAWMELGRLYTIKGQIEHARRAVLTALTLAPHDRYIVRCGVRFFLHIFDYASAWHYIRIANNHVRDPWLKATEINVAMINNKKTPRLKGLLPTDIKGNALFHYSELHESAGILELNAGNHKKAKKFFRTAWTTPAESVVTHAEWIIRNQFPGLKETAALDYARSLEALTWVQYYQYDLLTALDTVRMWRDEEPYSRSPFLVGACIAGSAGLPEDAIDFAVDGLKANPNDSRLLNSLCYESLRAGRIEEGQRALERWAQTDVDKDNDAFYLATAGLLMFKTNNVPEGRKLYLDAIAKCKELGSPHLVGKAYLNMALAEIEASTPEALKTASIALNLSNGDIHPDVRSLQEELISKTKRGK